MKRAFLILLLIGGTIGASAGNYELLVKAIRKMTDDIRYVKAELYQTRKDMQDIQDTIGVLSKKIHGASAEGVEKGEIEEKVRRLEARLDASEKEIRAYWEKVIEQRRAILDEAKRASDQVQRIEHLTPRDKADIQAIRKYLNE